MIEPIFERAGFTFTKDNPSVYTLISDGSRKRIHVHFCKECGTKLALTFERWPDRIGVYVGTLDDPAAISATKENSKYIFVSEARRGTILPPGVKIFDRHATANDGTLIEPAVYTSSFVVGAQTARRC